MMRRLPGCVATLMLAALASQSLLGGVVVLGWIQRWMGRRILAKALGNGLLVAGDEAVRGVERWPGMLLGDPGTSAGAGWMRRLVWRWTGGLWENLRVGCRTVAGLAPWLAVPGGLWAWSWYAGWQNSFHKGYEHAWVGPVFFSVGMIWFAVAMIFVPAVLASMSVRGLARARDGSVDPGPFELFHAAPWTAAGLGLAWVAVSVLFLLVKMSPLALAHLPGVASMPASEVLRRSDRLYLVAAGVMLPLMMMTRGMAAGWWVRAQASRAGGCAGGRVGRGRGFGGGVAMVVLFSAWLAYAAGVVVSEFFVKTPWGRGWWNQPILQIPWFNYTPPELRHRVIEERRMAGETVCLGVDEGPGGGISVIEEFHRQRRDTTRRDAELTASSFTPPKCVVGDSRLRGPRYPWLSRRRE